VSDPKEATVNDIIDAHLEKNGVAVSSVKDGHVFKFTLSALRQLVANAEAKQTDRVVLFVQRGAVN
jgi:hypothetical protein